MFFYQHNLFPGIFLKGCKIGLKWSEVAAAEVWMDETSKKIR